MSSLSHLSQFSTKRGSLSNQSRRKKIKKQQTDEHLTKYFVSTIDKQYIFKETANQFQEWCSWQKRILLCKCIERTPVPLLVVLNTSLEPILHRDYQVFFNHGFKSNLIQNFTVEKSQTTKKSEKRFGTWRTTSPLQKSLKKEKIVSSFIHVASEGRKSPFVKIPNPDISKLQNKKKVAHRHAIHRKAESITSIEFIPNNENVNVQRLGEHVIPTLRASTELTIKDYKQKKWWLPPIHDNSNLQKISKTTILQQFKNAIERIISMFTVWTNPEKGEFLLYLIDLCSPEDVKFLSNCIFQRIEDISDINRLSDNTLIKIFSFLNVQDLVESSQVCKRWNFLTSNNSLWMKECYHEALKHDQMEIIKSLEALPLEVNWKHIYIQLTETVTQLVPEQMNENIENEKTDDEYLMVEEKALKKEKSKSIIPCEENETTPEAVVQPDEDEPIDIHISDLHKTNLSDILDFNSNDDDDQIKEFNLPKVDTTDINLFSESENESLCVKNEIAFDVRPRLVQAVNDMKSKDEAIKVDDDDDYAQVPICGLKTIKRVRKLEGHSDAVLCVQFGCKRIMTGSSDRTVRLWDSRSGRNFRILKGHQGGVRCLQFDKRYIVTGSWDTTVMIWDAVHFTLLHTITEHTGCVSCIALTSKMLVTGSHDATVCIFERDSWNLFTTLQGHEGPVSCLLLLSEEELLTGSYDQTVLLWDIFEQTILRRFAYHNSPVYCLKVSGKLLACGCADGSLVFWDFKTCNKEGVVKAHVGAVNAICFISSKFVTGGNDHFIKEWDLATCTCLRSLTGHKGAVLSLRASNKRILSGSADGTARMWDFVCSLQQIGGPYDDMNKIIIPSEVINEREFNKISLNDN